MEKEHFFNDVDLFEESFFQNCFKFYPKLQIKEDAVYFSKSKCYGVFKYNAVKEVLRNKDSFSNKPFRQHDKILLGADGPMHVQAKKTLFQNLSYLQAEETIDASSNSKVLMNKLMDEVLSSRLLESFNAVDHVVNPYVSNIVLKEFGLLNQYPTIDLFSDKSAHSDKIQVIHTLFYGTLIQDIANFSINGGSVSPDLGRVLSEFSKNDAYSVEDLIKFVKVFTQAEMLTTASLLASCIYFMEFLDAERISENEHLEQFINEVLRIHSPSQFSLRYAEEDVSVGTVRIPKGSLVALYFGAANRDESIFPNHDKFKMNRDHKHIAFGGGSHKCIGEKVAMATAKNFIRAFYPFFNKFIVDNNYSLHNSAHVYKIESLLLKKK